MDYKELLRKYIRYVYESEGTDYLSEEYGLNGVHTDDWEEKDKFTDEEIEVLKEVCAKKYEEIKL